MREKLRCAVIGAGGIGLDHLQSLSRTPGAVVVAIAENNPERSKEASERFKISRSYSDYRELLDQPDIDAVTIALPNYLHARVAIEALQARKHVLLEKPMATNSRDAMKIIDMARKMKRVLMIGQNFRFNRHSQAAREAVQRGDLGEIYHARCFWLRRAGIPRIGSWFTQKQFAGGGCTYDIGVHMLDLCLHLINDFEVTTVSGKTHSKLGPKGIGNFDWGRSEIDPSKPFDVEDYSVAFLRLKSGRSLLMEASWAANHPSGAREYGVDLLGTAAGLSLFPVKLSRNGPTGYETVELMPAKPDYPEDRFPHFVSCVLERKKSLIPLEESLKLQQILDAIYESSRTGREVRLK